MLISCSICRFLFTTKDSDIMSDKAICCIPCGHSFHHKCLINWFKRDKSCPQCRTKAKEEDILYLYFTLEAADDDEEKAPNSLSDKLSKMKSNLADLSKIIEEFDRHSTEYIDNLRLLYSPFSAKIKSGDGYSDYEEAKEDCYVEPFAKKSEAILTLLDLCTEQAETLKRKLEKMKKEINASKQENGRRENKINDLEFRLSSITKDYQNEMKKKRELKEVIKRICNETKDTLDQARSKVEKWKKNYLTLHRTSESSCSSENESICSKESSPSTVKIDLTTDSPPIESSIPPVVLVRRAIDLWKEDTYSSTCSGLEKSDLSLCSNSDNSNLEYTSSSLSRSPGARRESSWSPCSDATDSTEKYASSWSPSSSAGFPQKYSSCSSYSLSTSPSSSENCSPYNSISGSPFRGSKRRRTTRIESRPKKRRK